MPPERGGRLQRLQKGGNLLHDLPLVVFRQVFMETVHFRDLHSFQPAAGVGPGGVAVVQFPGHFPELSQNVRALAGELQIEPANLYARLGEVGPQGFRFFRFCPKCHRCRFTSSGAAWPERRARSSGMPAQIPDSKRSQRTEIFRVSAGPRHFCAQTWRRRRVAPRPVGQSCCAAKLVAVYPRHLSRPPARSTNPVWG